MTGYTIVHGWAVEEADRLRKHASKVRTAYTVRGPMQQSCTVYASALEQAANLVEESARVIICMAAQAPGKADE